MYIDTFLDRVRMVMSSINRSLEVSQSEDAVDNAIVRLDSLIRNVNRMTAAYPGCADLLVNLSEAMDVFRDLKRSVEEETAARPAVHGGGSGRPRLIISKEQLQLLLELNFSNKDIAELMHISVSSVKRRLRVYNMSRHDRFSNLTDGELDDRIRQITQVNPMLGQRNVMGQLLADGIRVQRDRVAESLLRVDPAALAMRWSQTIYRRTYSVPGPNALWHIDGNHKLVRWGFVIHGGMDGYSRSIVFLKASTDNRAATVFSRFLEATHLYGVPSRVRCDHGGENVEVAMFMNTLRGHNRGSCITGRSVHNQRIERFWRDLYQGCTCIYRELFIHLVREGALDLDSNLHMWCLQYVYLPRLNRDLKKFQAGWNNHRLRSEHGRTPLQLYVQGVLANRGSGQRGIDDLFYEPPIMQEALPEDFGVDWDGPVPHTNEDAPAVQNVTCPLTAEQLENVRRQVNPMADSVDGIDIYLRLLGLC